MVVVDYGWVAQREVLQKNSPGTHRAALQGLKMAQPSLKMGKSVCDKQHMDGPFRNMEEINVLKILSLCNIICKASNQQVPLR